MTSTASLHHDRHSDGLDGERFALPRKRHEIVGGADDGIEPVELAEALAAEDHADIVSVPFDLAAHLGNLEFWKTKRIRRLRREFQHCHCNLLPALSAKCARGTLNMGESWNASKFDAAGISTVNPLGLNQILRAFGSDGGTI